MMSSEGGLQEGRETQALGHCLGAPCSLNLAPCSLVPPFNIPPQQLQSVWAQTGKGVGGGSVCECVGVCVHELGGWWQAGVR